MRRFSVFLIGVILCAMLGQTGYFSPMAHAAADLAPPESEGWVQVSTAEQLAYINKNQSLYLHRNILLMNDIDMTGYQWIPFGGNDEAKFSGIFDGRGYRVSGIHIPLVSLQYVGFFGQSSGIVKNLGVVVGIDGGTFTSAGTTTTGGLIGELDGGSIDYCYVQGKVVGVNATSGLGAISSITGGLVGQAKNSSITNSSSMATVIGGNGPNKVNGGLVGAQGTGTVSNVYARGEVSSPVDQFVDLGGVIGLMVYGTIDKGYGTGKVSLQGSGSQGGFAGSLFVGTNIWKSYFDSETTGQSNGVGSYYEGAADAFGQTTDKMKQQSTYSGWDFVHTWAMHPSVNDGYPFLRPAILTTALPNANKDVSYTLTLTAFDGASGGLTWQADGLPAGMSLSSNGVLQGTPRQTGSFNIEITVKDAGDASATALLQLVVKESAPDIKDFQIAPGSAIGTTNVTAVPVQSGHSFAYIMSSQGNARPLVGDVLPAEATPYTPGLDIPNVHEGQYLEIYEVDRQFLIQAWYTVQLADAHIKSDIPTGLQAVIEDEKVKLTWDLLEGAESYRVYKFEGTAVQTDPHHWTLVNENELREAAFVVPHLTPGKRYWLAVTSILNGEESKFSNPVSIIPVTSVKEVVPPEEIKVGRGIELADLGNYFPDKVRVRVSDLSLLEVDVSWDAEQTDYDPNKAGAYKLIGQLQLQEYVRNPSSLQVELAIVVLKNTNALLDGIYLDDGMLQGFHPDIFTYHIEVPYETDRLMITAATFDASASYEVTGGHVQDLEVGDNSIKIVVSAEDQTEQMTYTINVKRKPDQVAPQWTDSSQLAVSDITQTSVKLSWPVATDNVGVIGYRIYVNEVERETTSGSTYEAIINELTENMTYMFKVVAFDAEGNESEALTASAQTLPHPPEPDSEAPQWLDGRELMISDITQTNVKLSWPSATDNVGVSGYRIYVNDVERETASGSTYAAIINELTQNMTYTFKVVAFDAEGNESEALSKQATTARSSAGGGYALSNNADLTDLQIWGEVEQLKLSPSFASGTTEYRARTEAEQVEIAAITSHVMAKVILEDNVITDKVKVNLIDGDNIFVLTVLAENGTKKEYTLIIHRELAKPTAPLIEFTDIAGHWAEGSIKQAVSQGMISGYPNRMFKPDDSVTRAEFTVMLADALNLDGKGAVFRFTDDDQIAQWAKRAVSLALQVEIVDGYKDGSFRPNAQITRAEMASMIAKALKVTRNVKTTTSFADDEDIPIWAKSAVEAIHKLGIVNGRGGNKFVPNDTATRSEAVVMLLSMLEVRE